jgi:hypothetical protein
VKDDHEQEQDYKKMNMGSMLPLKSAVGEIKGGERKDVDNVEILEFSE